MVRTAPRPDAHTTLYCLPHAGGAASAYRDWSAYLPAWLEVVAVQLPGRENRVAEPSAVSPEDTAAAVAADLSAHPDRSIVLFGHSMGGLLAFEVARLLARDSGPALAGLFVSGSAHPAAKPHTDPTVSQLSDTDLLAWAVALGGMPAWIVAEPQMHELVLPVLRADCAWLENHVYRADAPLACPITVMAGEADAHVGTTGLQAWQVETTGIFRMRRHPGGHFYADDTLPEVLGGLADDVREWL
ncbi:alpha/beta fold hydrolase [Streptomyces sp. H27-C3]|uniref:thioesterase II family protein n=1 Tax=Streptomyces sp. H27-C3 TaxID=3046305 RepID=UPI0024B9B95C|nr:alpha/beta fold hydrolase [Streptomyces sp. H27-C3]MDJ0463812.1 alpha/beta fold hydrolase [Streptomyces sp. H27-C3]